MSKSMCKDCEIGSIPTNWNIQKLEELANVTGGKRLPKGSSLSEINNGHPYIRVSDMNDKGIQLDSMLYVPDDVVEQISRYRVDKDDLYISVAGTLGLVGKVPDELNGANLTENADRISNIRCNTDFLLYCLKSDFIKKIINSEMTTNAQPKLALTRIKQFPIPVPPLKEQQKIAEILSSVDAAIEKTEQVIAKTEEVKKRLMQQLLTKGIGHTEYKNSELGEIPLKWEIKQLKDLLEIKYGKDQKQVICENGKYNILGTGGIIGKTNSYLYDKPSVLIGRKGTINRPMYIEEPFWTVDTLFYTVINPNNFEKWIYYVISNINLMKYNEATGVPSLSVNNLNTIKFAVPPYDEQVKIVNILDSTEQKIQSENLKLNRLMILKQGLMQQLLTGKVRVKV